MEKVDIFAHVLPPVFYKQMLEIDSQIPERAPFIKHPLLTEPNLRNQYLPTDCFQVISAVNVNPEDYVDSKKAAALCRAANDEISDIVNSNPKFLGGIAMLPMNNVDEAVGIIESIRNSSPLLGAQIFTRALGKSIADQQFEPVFAAAAKNHIPLLLHPVFDPRKPDNNIVFSWEYELSNAMLQIVQAGIFSKYPDLKIIVHHAGAMVPFFAGRIKHILPEEQVTAFHQFYVDTAILGNPPALRLTVDYFGEDHVLFGTDAPLGIAPAGATKEIIAAIDRAEVSSIIREKIFNQNFKRIFENQK
ncbi:amidohydrolase family protein [Limosilactobacillus agrestis]|uniref:amidohydrolase family protein n=1 Tax=Limosilactobacillus agrestis TaxID=2759748 RepID=UPI001E57FAB9|nr:amidohydrolase family protein [Limosilactobacillus agrestis]